MEEYIQVDDGQKLSFEVAAGLRDGDQDSEDVAICFRPSTQAHVTGVLSGIIATAGAA